MEKVKRSTGFSKLQVVLLITFGSVLFLISGYFFYNSERESLLENKRTELKTIAELKQKQISDWYSDEIVDAKIISSNVLVTETLLEFNFDNSDRNLAKVSKLMGDILSIHNYSELIISNKTGGLLYSTNLNRNKIENILVTHLEKVNENKSATVVDLYKSNQNDRVFLSIISPIFDKNNQIRANLIFNINANQFLHPLLNYWPVPTKTAETLLFRREGQNVLFLSELNRENNIALNFQLPMERTELPAVQALKGHTGVFEGVDYSNREVFSYINSIPNTNWFLVAKIDKEEVLSGLNQELINTILITTLFILLTAMGIILIYNSRQKTIYKEFYQQQKDLWQLEKRFKVTVESLGEGIIISDTKGKIRYMNRIAEDLTGWKRQEANGRDIVEVYKVKNEETGLFESKILDKVLREGVVKELANHTILISKSNDEIPVMDTGAPIYDNSGNLSGLVITFQNETEKREQIRLLEESENRFRSSLDNMLEGCQIIGKDWTYVYVNDVAAMHGRTKKEKLIGKKMMEVYPGIEKSELFKHLENCMNEGKSHRMDNEFEFPDGEKGWFELNIEPLDEGIFILSIDITKRKKSELAHQASEAKYRHLVENINDAIFSMNKNGKIEYVSPAVEDMLDFKPKEVIGKNFDEFLQSYTIENSIENIIKSQEPVDIPVTSKKNKNKWVRISRSPIYEGEKIIGVRGVISDITEKVNTMKELTKAKEKAEEMNKLKSHFFANMSHELRTPFVGIMGYAELLTSILEDPEEKEMAKGILRTSERMKITLTKILNLSKIEFNGIKIELVETDLKEIIENVFDQFSNLAKDKNLSLTKNIDFKQSFIETDKTLLTEILTNLVSNAIIYTEEGGVDVSAEKKIDKNGENLIVKVSDTGIGIPKGKQSIIWEEFRQVSEGTTRAYQGTGLGLTIVKKYTKLLDGSIRLDSEKGKGSTFILEIPLNPTNKNQQSNFKLKEDDNNSNGNGQKRILYVEDDKASADVLRSKVSEYYKFEHTDDPHKALNKLIDCSYDAILMDINLGHNIDGKELTQRIRKMDCYKKTPIIAVTAYADPHDRTEYISKGMSHFIAKPYKMKNLINLLHKVLKKENSN